VILHNANWKADYLANYVEIAKATLHLDNGEVRWDPVDFSYGPVKGTASLTLPANCDPASPACPGLTCISAIWTRALCSGDSGRA